MASLKRLEIRAPPPPSEPAPHRRRPRGAAAWRGSFGSQHAKEGHKRSTDVLARRWRERCEARQEPFASQCKSRLQRLAPAHWGVAEVLHFLRGAGLETLVQVFDEHEVDGMTLLEVGEADLDYMGVRALAHRKRVLALVRGLQGTAATKATRRHWSELEPIANRAVSNPAGAAPPANLADGCFDEAAAAADFQRAVQDWRAAAKPRRSLLLDIQAEGEAEAESGMWRNPFA